MNSGKFKEIILANPIIIFSLSILLGIAIGYHVIIDNTTYLIITLLAVYALIFAIFSKFKSETKILLFCISGLFLGIWRIDTLQTNSNKHISQKNGLKDLSLTGKILSIRHYNQNKSPLEHQIDIAKGKGYFVVETKELRCKSNKEQVEGKIQIYYNKFVPAINISDIVELNLTSINSPVRPSNPGQFDYSVYLSKQGIYSAARISEAADIKVISCEKDLRYFISKVREKFRNIYYSLYPQDTAAFLSALILGYQEDVSENLVEGMQKTGTTHLLVISGLHFVFAYYWLWVILTLAGISGRTQSTVIILFLTFYALLTGMTAPVLRAYFMLLFYLMADLLWRKKDSLNSVFSSAVIILLINPMELFSVSFQLSYAAVLGILLITSSLEKYLMPTVLNGEGVIFMIKHIIINKFIKNGLTVSLSAWLATMPIVSSNFLIITPIIIIANLILGPLISLIMAMGFLTIIAELLLHNIAYVISQINNLCFKMFEVSASILAAVPSPFSFTYTPPASVTIIAVYYILLLIWIIWIKNSKLNTLKIITSSIFVLLITFPLFSKYFNKTEFSITTFDTESGSCTLVQRPNNLPFLFDCGATGYKNPAKQLFIPALLNKGIKEMDFIVLSSSDPDHTNSALEVGKAFKIKKIIVSDYFSVTENGQNLIQQCNESGIKVEILSGLTKIPAEISSGIELYHPPPRYVPIKSESTAIVIAVKSMGHVAVLTGDLDGLGLEMLTNAVDLKCDILLAPNHAKKLEQVKYYDKYTKLLQNLKPKVIHVNAEIRAYDNYIIDGFRMSGAKSYITGHNGMIESVFLPNEIKTITFIKSNESGD